MLKKLLEFAGFPGLIRQAQDIMQTVEKQPPTQALASLMNWLPGAIERCGSPLQQLELLNTVTPGAAQIIAGVHRDLMASEGNLVRSQLLMQHSAPLAAWMRDQYAVHLHHALPTLQKSGPAALWAQATSHYLDWTSSAFVLAFFVPPPPTGLAWHSIYAIYEPARQMLERNSPTRLLGRSDSLRQQVQKSMARLLLLVRSLATDLGGRQTLIAAQLVELLHVSVNLGDQHGQNTPYGTDIHESNPPTLLDVQKPPQDQHKLFFGVESALQELISIESRILAQGALPAPVVIAEGQSTAETLTVIKHLRNRWSGRPAVRKANRSLVQQSADIVATTARIHQLLAGDTAASNKPLPRISAQIEDRSATGYGLQIEGPAPWAAVGGLLALFVPETARWSVGTIRRVATRPKNRVMLGLQLLSSEPLALRLQETAAATRWQLVAQDSLDSHRAIYIGAGALSNGQSSLITQDRVLRAGELYRARHAGEDLWIRVKAVLELGADFVRWSCELESAPQQG